MSNTTEVKNLLDAGVHFGHLTRKWNPNMAPYIYMERNGIHIINLYKTAAKLEEAKKALKKLASTGRKILFVATKKQAKDIMADQAQRAQMPYITERWPGGMLTNFVTIRRAVKKMAAIDKMKQDGSFDTLSKKERLQVDRQRAKLEKTLGSISEMTRLPGALFVVDTTREQIAVSEAQKLNIPVFAMVDTNSDPEAVDYAIPSNDDASKSIRAIVSQVTDAVVEGLETRKAEREAEKTKKETAAASKAAEDKKEDNPSAKSSEKKAEATTTDKKPAEETTAKKSKKTTEKPASAKASEKGTKAEPAEKKAKKETETAE